MKTGLGLFLSNFVLLIMLFNAGCKKINTVELNSEFKDMTESGFVGPEPTGNSDCDDWMKQFNYSGNDTVPPLLSLSVKPGYPNPTSRFTTFTFEIPTEKYVFIRLKDRPRNKNKTILSSYLRAGIHSLLIALKYGEGSLT